MGSVTGHQMLDRRMSLPSSPISAQSGSSVSYETADTTERRRSNGVSWIQDIFRQSSTSLQQKFERKLLLTAERHMQMPLPLSGPRGLVFHVVDLPGHHSRDSVAGVLSRSIDWLRDNPHRGTSPFTTANTNVSDSTLDLMDSDPEHLDMPALEPTTSLSLRHKWSIKTMDFGLDALPALYGGAAEAVNSAMSTCSDTLIDFEPPLPNTIVDQRPTVVCNNDASPKTDVHEEVMSSSLHSISSAGSEYPRSPSREVYDTTLSLSCKSEYDVDQTNDEVDHNRTQTLLTDQVRPTQLSASMHIPRKPVPCLNVPLVTNAPRIHIDPPQLGAGLRSLPPPLLAVSPLPLTAAASSTELLDRSHASKAQPLSKPSPQRLVRKPGTRDLRMLSQQFGRSENTPPSNTKQERIAVQIPAYNSVAEKINLYEKPLPELPEEAVLTVLETTAKSRKRFGVYGTPDDDQDGVSSVRNHIDNKHGKQKPVAVDTLSKSERQPASQPIDPPGVLTSPSISWPVAMSTPPSPQNWKFRAMKEELFFDIGESPLSPNKADPSLSCSQIVLNETSTPLSQLTESLPGKTISKPAPSEHLPYIPYSPSLSSSFARRGTLEQLGGRVVQIRKNFEKNLVNRMPSSSSHASNASFLSRCKGAIRSHSKNLIPATTSDAEGSPRTQNHHTNPAYNSAASAPRKLSIESRTPLTSHTSSSDYNSTNCYQAYQSSRPPPADHDPHSYASRTHQQQEQPNLYALLHPDQAKRPGLVSSPATARFVMSQATRNRLLDTAAEAESVSLRQHR